MDDDALEIGHTPIVVLAQPLADLTVFHDHHKPLPFA
jgi:hypothetical protein